jgi:hypothetical protein
MSVFEVQDCCGEINRHLSLAQLFMVRKYRLWYAKPVSIRTIVITRLVEVGYDLDVATDIVDAVYKSKSILSWSFMLAVLVTPLDRSLAWVPHNVNVYTNRHLEGPYPSMIQCSEYSNARNYTNPPYNTPIRQFRDELLLKIQGPYRISPYTDYIQNTTTHPWSKSVQVPRIDETIFESRVNNIAKRLFNTHDFDFLKIAYNGNSLLVDNLDCVLAHSKSLDREFEYNSDYIISRRINCNHNEVAPNYQSDGVMPELVT